MNIYKVFVNPLTIKFPEINESVRSVEFLDE